MKSNVTKIQILEKFFHCSIEQLAYEYGYSDENILVLKKEEKDILRFYPDLWDKIDSCRHHRDSRTPIQYAFDLVSSWLVEDYVIRMLNANDFGLVATHNGADANRNILHASKISAKSDILLSIDGVEKHMEIMNDYHTFWRDNKALHLRDNKYNQLKNDEALLLALCLPLQNFAIIDVNEIYDARYIQYHRPFGCKPAYEIPLSDEFQKFVPEMFLSAVVDSMNVSVFA